MPSPVIFDAFQKINLPFSPSAAQPGLCVVTINGARNMLGLVGHNFCLRRLCLST